MKIKAISLDETRFFVIREEDKPLIKAIRSTYIYNPDEVTHCCELTPSYDLRYLHTYIVFDGDPSDEVRGELDEYYCHEGGDDQYFHCRDIDRIAAPWQKDCGKYESMDEAIEYLQGNWPL